MKWTDSLSSQSSWPPELEATLDSPIGKIKVQKITDSSSYRNSCDRELKNFRGLISFKELRTEGLDKLKKTKFSSHDGLFTYFLAFF